MDVNVYTLQELASHVLPILSDNTRVTPLSPLRLDSYLHNPRAAEADPVLFELHIDNQLVAYRTVLPDLFYDSEGRPQRFAWLSGNWVDPQYRRQGLSTRLLKQVVEHWEGRLIYTNYAPASRAVYDKSGQFRLLAGRTGYRFYLRSAAHELLKERSGDLALLKAGDGLINRFREGRLSRFQPVDDSQCRVEIYDALSGKEEGKGKEEVEAMVKRLQQGSLFGRDGTIFDWILQYPWITEQKGEPVNYHFSYSASRFKNIVLHFTLPVTGKQGLLWMTLHNNRLTVPYLFYEEISLLPLMARTVLHTMIRNNCTHTTVRDPGLQQQLKAYRKWFLLIRRMPQLIFAHNKLLDLIPAGRKIHDGDGDVVFTG